MISDTHDVSPDEALERLLSGNGRFSNGNVQSRGPVIDDRVRLLDGQRPYASILTCADSRVSPEIIFDAGLGELFVVRNAGNVVDELVTGSLEFSAVNLKVSLILVFGHSDCGAVRATINNTLSTRNVSLITEKISYSVQASGNHLPEVDLIARVNATVMVDRLLESSVLQNLVLKGELKIIAGFYDLESGVIELL